MASRFLYRSLSYWDKVSFILWRTDFFVEQYGGKYLPFHGPVESNNNADPNTDDIDRQGCIQSTPAPY